MSSDPIYDGVRDGMSIYGYCYNNPLIYHDPSGLENKSWKDRWNDFKQAWNNFWSVPANNDKNNTNLFLNTGTLPLINDQGSNTTANPNTQTNTRDPMNNFTVTNTFQIMLVVQIIILVRIYTHQIQVLMLHIMAL